MPSGVITTTMDALIWDANPDAHRFAEAALQAILLAYPELEHHKGRGNVKTVIMLDPFHLREELLTSVFERSYRRHHEPDTRRGAGCM